MSKSNDKRQKFTERNRKVANSLGNVFVGLFMLAIVARSIQLFIESFRDFLTEVVGIENLKVGFTIFCIVCVSYVIYKFLFGGNLEGD